MNIYIKAENCHRNIVADHITAYKDGQPTVISWKENQCHNDGNGGYSGWLGGVCVNGRDARGSISAISRYDLYAVTFTGRNGLISYAVLPAVTSIMFDEDGRFARIPEGRCLANLSE